MFYAMLFFYKKSECNNNMIFFEQLICYNINKIQMLDLTPNNNSSKFYFSINVIKWWVTII